jgi:hypothetical protein
LGGWLWNGQWFAGQIQGAFLAARRNQTEQRKPQRNMLQTQNPAWHDAIRGDIQV